MPARGDVTSARIRSAGWRQGSIVDKADLQALHIAGSSADLAVVLSQDCDLLQPIEAEPVVELLPGARIPSSRGDLLHGRNPRLLDLVLTENAGELPATFRARDRVSVPKETFAATNPSASLSLPANELRCLRDWVARRYKRAAFPDAFNERLKQVSPRLDRLSKSPEGVVVTGIYVLLVEGEVELPDGQDYHSVIWLTIEPTTRDDATAFEMAHAYEHRLKDILETCPGIRLEAPIEVRGEDDITLSDLRLMKRLDLDYRSHAPRPGGAFPPEGV